jgi:uncharacterized protein YdaU (DUF1376 family)
VNGTSKGHLPWIKLWVADFITDSRVAMMSNAALGLYFRLLFLEWNEGPFSADHRVLARITHTSFREFAKLWPEIAPLFTETTDGRLMQRRLERERADAEEQHERRVAGGKMTATKLWGPAHDA